MLQGSPPEVLDIVFCTQTKHSCHNEEFCLRGRGFKIPGACERSIPIVEGLSELGLLRVEYCAQEKVHILR